MYAQNAGVHAIKSVATSKSFSRINIGSPIFFINRNTLFKFCLFNFFPGTYNKLPAEIFCEEKKFSASGRKGTRLATAPA